MAKIDYDGVVEAVRYTPEGTLDWARMFLRRGPTFSDYILVDRQTLIEHLKAGKRYMVGKRIPQLASTFSVSVPVRVIQKDGKELVVAGNETVDRDYLAGAPVL